VIDLIADELSRWHRQLTAHSATPPMPASEIRRRGSRRRHRRHIALAAAACLALATALPATLHSSSSHQQPAAPVTPVPTRPISTTHRPAPGTAPPAVTSPHSLPSDIGVTPSSAGGIKGDEVPENRNSIHG
jgi:hypothetical protein